MPKELFLCLKIGSTCRLVLEKSALGTENRLIGQNTKILVTGSSFLGFQVYQY
jgi:hypothetical protein